MWRSVLCVLWRMGAVCVRARASDWWLFISGTRCVCVCVCGVWCVVCSVVWCGVWHFDCCLVVALVWCVVCGACGVSCVVSYVCMLRVMCGVSLVVCWWGGGGVRGLQCMMRGVWCGVRREVSGFWRVSCAA